MINESVKKEEFMIYHDEILEISYSLKNLALLIDTITASPELLSKNVIERLTQYQNIILAQISSLEAINENIHPKDALEMLRCTEGIADLILDDAKELLSTKDLTDEPIEDITHWC